MHAMSFFRCFVIQFLVLQVLLGADTWEVLCSRVDLKCEFGTVTLTSTEEGKLSMIQIVGRDYKVLVPITELADTPSPRLQSARVVSTRHPGFSSMQELGNDDYLVVYLEYGEVREVAYGAKGDGTKVKTVLARDRAYYIFTRVGYSHRDRLVAKDYSHIWTIHYKDAGEPEIENGTITLPFPDSAPWDPPSLPTKN